MKLFFTLFLSLAVATAVLAQAPAIQWHKKYGGTNGSDYATSIQQTSDGGYVVAGYTYSNDGYVTGNHGNSDYWIVKISNTGTLQWQKALGGTGSDQATSIQQTSDGGYIVAGYVKSNDGDVAGNHGNDDYWVVKLNSTGTLQWQKTLGGTGSDQATSIQQTYDGGYIVAGYTESNNGDITGSHGNADYWVVKLSSTGSLQWQKTLGGTGVDQATSIQQTSDSGYVVAGYARSNNGDVAGNHGNSDYWIVKISNTGTLQWQKTLGGTDNEVAFALQQTSDGGYVVAGYAESNNGDVTGNHGDSDYWIVKLNSAGTLQWQKAMGGSNNDWAYSIQQTTDGGYIVGGSNNSYNSGDVTNNHGFYDSWAVKLSSTGTLIWQKSFGGSLYDDCLSIRQTTDGGYIMAGRSDSNDGDLSGTSMVGEYWIVKLGPDPAAVSNTSMSETISLYLNPATTELRLQCSEAFKSITVTDLAGRTLYKTDSPAPVTEATVPTATLPDGLYLVRLQTSTGTRTMKFQVQQ